MPRRTHTPYLSTRGDWYVKINGKRHYLGRHLGEIPKIRKGCPPPDHIKTRYHEIMRDAVVSASTRPTTVAKLVTEWLERQHHPDHAYRLDSFLSFAGSHRLHDLNQATLEDFRDWLDAKDYAASTVRDRVRLAARVLRWAHKHDWLEISIEVPTLKRARRAAKDVQPEHLAAALAELSDRPRRILCFIAATGCRPSEARMLEWDQVHIDRRVAIISEHKTAGRTGHDKVIHLHDYALAILDETPRESEQVFLSRLRKPYTASGLRCIMRRAGERAGVGYITPYQLRHTAIQQAVEQLPLQDVQALFGHTDIATTQHYFRIAESRAASASQQLLLPQLPGDLVRPVDRSDDSRKLRQPRQSQATDSMQPGTEPKRAGRRRA